jgi:hypothetical protein
MANQSVTLADIYNPVAFATGIQEDQIELNRFIQSGIITGDPRVSAFAQSGGTLNEIAFLKPLGTDEPNYSSDDITEKSETKKLSGSKMQVRTAYQNQSWSSTDLASEVALVKPLPAITSRIGSYWATINERRIIASVTGILADNVANDSGDMVLNKAITTGTIADTNRINATNIIGAVQTMGDHGENLRAMAMHSAPYRQLQIANLIDYIPDSMGNVDIPTYQGKRVIVDDSLAPDTTVPAYPVYTIYLFTEGAFVGGEGMPENASELDRDPDAGNGGGETKLYSRRTDIAHPLGFSCVGTPAGNSLTLAELRLAATWDRVWERKNTGIAALKVNL